MAAKENTREYRTWLKVFLFGVVGIWTAIIAASWVWNIGRARSNTLEQARIEAKVAFEKDIVYRRWNTLHNGVYVRVTEKTPPNPYLADVPSRDITTTSGMRLTLINPAYMTRQVYEMAGGESGLKGRITSTNPLRPGNAPDEWEHRALNTFEQGQREFSSIQILEDGEYMRLMRPLVTEEGCLNCHAEQGYAVGDIRGGLSVSVPMEPLRAIERKSIITLSVAHGLLWLLGFLGHFYGTGKLMRSERKRWMAEEDTRRYAGKLEESNSMKELFIDIMRHDLLNPTGVIKCYASYLIEDETDERKKDLCMKIDMANSKLIEMIENASKYSRLEELKSIECSGQDLLKIVKEAVSYVFCQDRWLSFEITYRADGEYPAWVNPMIGDVFANLATNAAKYASEGGKLEIGILEQDGFWQVYFKDFGPGIDDADKGRIFTRFERLEKEGVKGTGLGLAIANRLVELHRGKIWVEDNPEGGCVFFVSLPRAGDGQPESFSSPSSTVTP